ncbi:MAG: LexA family transcriptional regulator [Bacteroidaceae bacterium]|nr:LexA family transcriptional regulator [Bacteroidaceae bacterium]
MTVEEKINILVERYCRNRSHLANLIDISPQAVNNWVYRDRIPRRGIKAILAKFPQIDPDWLCGGSTPLPSGPLPLPEEEEEGEEEHHVDNTVPSKASAQHITGMQSSPDDSPQPENREGLVPVQMPRHDIKYVFQCHGDSMLPRIQDRDYVGVGEAIGRYEEFHKGTPYLIQTTNGRLMVKMVQDPGPTLPYLLLSTENPNYELADGGKLAKKELYAAYRVIMVMRDI